MSKTENSKHDRFMKMPKGKRKCFVHIDKPFLYSIKWKNSFLFCKLKATLEYLALRQCISAQYVNLIKYYISEFLNCFNGIICIDQMLFINTVLGYLTWAS